MILLMGLYLITLTAEFLQACSDCREIVGGTGSGRHISSVCLSSGFAATIAHTAPMAALSRGWQIVVMPASYRSVTLTMEASA
jgi:hypothetical protein